MGTAPAILLNVFRAMHPAGLPSSFRLLEMGNTQTYGPVEEFSALFEFLRVPDAKIRKLSADYGTRSASLGAGVYNLELMPAVGLSYECVDYTEPTTIKADLNSDRLPRKLHGQFDLVTNFGTSEHVADQMNFLRYVHDATKIGGVMIHMVPMIGYLGHCLYKYDPKFFVRLAAANSYETLYAGFGPQEPGVTVDNECGSWVGYEPIRGRRFDSHLAEFILRKRHSAGFQKPIDANLEAIELWPQPASVRTFPPQLRFAPFAVPTRPPLPSEPPHLKPRQLARAIHSARILWRAATGDGAAQARVRRRLRAITSRFAASD